MKKILLASLTLLCSFAVNAAANYECVVEQTVEHVDVGYFVDAQGGADTGAAIFVKYGDGQILSQHNTINANEGAGQSMLSLLTTALVTGLKVTAFGQDENCAYTTGIRLHKSDALN